MQILVVEDNADVAFTLAELLRIDGYENVRIASDGPTGLEMARSSIPDVVLCDIGLPGRMSGLEFAKACRAEPALQTLHLVAMSGFGGAEDRKRAIDAGFNELLAKPVRFETLSDCVRRGHKES